MSDTQAPLRYRRGDVVQIIDEEDPWFGCLLVVKEPKKTLFQGFVYSPASNIPQGEAGHRAPVQYFRRPRYEQVRYIGRAALALNDTDTEEQ